MSIFPGGAAVTVIAVGLTVWAIGAEAQNLEIAPPGSAESYIELSLFSPNFGPFERCFGKAKTYSKGMKYYDNILAHRDKSCMVAVMDTSVNPFTAIPYSGGRYVLRVMATGGGMAPQDCGLKALSCVKPKIAAAVSKRFGLSIETVPIRKQK